MKVKNERNFNFLPKKKEKMNGWTWTREKVVEVFGLDVRSLALLRIVLGLIALFDLLDRSQDMYAHYANDGMFQNHVILADFVHPSWLSVHFISGSDFATVLLFAAHAAIALAFLLGWWTRTSSVLLWFMTASLQARSPFVLHGGDDYVRLVHFYAMFLPLGACYSLDNALSSFRDAAADSRNPRDRPGSSSVPSRNWRDRLEEARAAAAALQLARAARLALSVLRMPRSEAHPSLRLSFAGIGLQLQITWVYLISTFFKISPQWTVDYTSTYLALHLDWYRTTVGDWMLFGLGHAPLRILTYLVLQWEFYGMFFAFLPVFTPYGKLLCAAGFMAMHAGFGSCMRLGQFIYIGVGAFVVFLPPLFWDTLLRWLNTRERTELVLLYEPRHGLTALLVRLLEQFFLLPTARIAPFEPHDRGLKEQVDGEDVGDAETALPPPSPVGAGGPMVSAAALEDDHVVDDAGGSRRRAAYRSSSAVSIFSDSGTVAGDGDDAAAAARPPLPGRAAAATLPLLESLRPRCRDLDNYVVCAGGSLAPVNNMDALVRVLGLSPILFPLAYPLRHAGVLRRGLDQMYTLHYRYSMLVESSEAQPAEIFLSWSERRRLIKAQRRASLVWYIFRRAVKATLASCLVFAMLWTVFYNVHVINSVVHANDLASYYQMSGRMIDMGQIFRLQQHWRYVVSPSSDLVLSPHAQLTQSVRCDLECSPPIRPRPRTTMWCTDVLRIMPLLKSSRMV